MHLVCISNCFAVSSISISSLLLLCRNQVCWWIQKIPISFQVSTPIQNTRWTMHLLGTPMTFHRKPKKSTEYSKKYLVFFSNSWTPHEDLRVHIILPTSVYFCTFLVSFLFFSFLFFVELTTLVSQIKSLQYKTVFLLFG